MGLEKYRPFDQDSIIEYIRSKPEIHNFLGYSEEMKATEVGDGNLNLVFLVAALTFSEDVSVIVKQALPYMRLVGSDWPLLPDRARIEAESLRLQNVLVPEFSPKLYYYDPEMYLLAMENLKNHKVLRSALINCEEMPNLGRHIGLFLASMLGQTSDLILDPDTKRRYVSLFENSDLRKMTETLVFSEPYRKTTRNAFHEEIGVQVEEIQADLALHTQVALLKEKFMTHTQALIHGDLHTGSIMVNTSETYIIDSEFAFYGPMGFDLGAIVGNLFLNFSAQEYRIENKFESQKFKRYVLETVREIWSNFCDEFDKTVWCKVDELEMPKSYQSNYMLRILRDTCGFAGCKMMRRVIGLAGVEDIRGISNVEAKSLAASLALNIGKELVLQHQRVKSIEDVITIVESQRPSYPYMTA